ncbi:MAG TPA: hypothetical protein PLH44_01255 [Bacilli bacterium]|jgi:hypothetical protein|nr:hypothetical protein [Bacilli bacterium]HOR17598.1 hypothetical protein [Bacilli bacterium]HPL55138.1 hypothetical protein [Bacilli bacterium]
MFITSWLLQAGIIFGAITLFLITFILNKRTKAPKGAEVPDKCRVCDSPNCLIKMSDIDKIKSELKQQLEHDCPIEEDKNNEKK